MLNDEYCTTCSGSGYLGSGDECGACRGEGRVPPEEYDAEDEDEDEDEEDDDD